LVALGEYRDDLLLAGAVRQRDRAAQLLVRVADVQAGADVHLDGLRELRALHALDEADRVGRLVGGLAVDLLVELAVALASLGHQPTSTPIERPVPSMIFAA